MPKGWNGAAKNLNSIIKLRLKIRILGIKDENQQTYEKHVKINKKVNKLFMNRFWTSIIQYPNFFMTTEVYQIVTKDDSF